MASTMTIEKPASSMISVTNAEINGTASAAGSAKKSAWNKPGNGSGSVVNVEPVMGTSEWPTLRESVKGGSESLLDLSDALAWLSRPQDNAGHNSTNNATPSQGPVSQSSTGNGSMQLVPVSKSLIGKGGTQAVSLSQNPLGKGGMQPVPLSQNPLGNGGKQPVPLSQSPSGTGDMQPVPVSQSPLENGDMQPVPVSQSPLGLNSSHSSPNGGMQPQPQHMTAPAYTLSTNHSQRSAFVSSPLDTCDNPHRKNRYRNYNGGPHPHGNGSHHLYYGSMHGQGRENQEWIRPQNFNARDVYMQPYRGGPRFMRPIYNSAPNPTSFIPYAPPRPFPDQMAYHGQYYDPTVYQHMRPPQAIYTNNMVDPELPQKIRSQIEYYFSKDNLVKDVYLRQRMDEQGWVSISLIAGFRKVKELTSDIQLITNALRSSTNVEVQGDKVRKRIDWARWILPHLQFP